jgi:hypothetical protein
MFCYETKLVSNSWIFILLIFKLIFESHHWNNFLFQGFRRHFWNLIWVFPT